MTVQLIELLRNRNGFISGEEISKYLGITRAGVWKKVKSLRGRGYLIEAVPSKGYRLFYSPDMPTREEMRAIFRGDIIGKEIIFYQETTSTNDRAMEIGNHMVSEKKGDPEGTVIIADAQEQGRGRFGRTWISPPHGNLYFSVLLRPGFSPKEASITTLMAAVSVVSAIREHVDLKAVIKWPNDILIGDKKVAGILTEMKSDMDRIYFVAVGVGVNVNMPLKKLPKDIRRIATSLKEEKGKDINRVKLLGAILAKVEYWYKCILDGERKALLDEWLLLNSTVGNRVRVKAQDRIVSGIAEGISNDGELVVRLSSGDIEKVYAGEVTIL